MVTGSRTEGATPILSARVRKTIQTIKEIVGNHSDAEIYVALKEANMDPNETTQKLLNQDPFHEVKSKRDRRKESMGYKGSGDPRRRSENAGQGMKYNNRNPDRNAENVGQGMKYNNRNPDRNTENAGQGMKYNRNPDRNAENGGQGMKYHNAENAGQGVRYNAFSDRNARRGSYNRNALPGISREFRVVRDNRVNRDTNREVKPASPQTSTNEEVVLNPSEKGSTATATNQKPLAGQNRFQPSNGSNDSQPRHARDANSSSIHRKEGLEEKRGTVPNAVSRVQAVKPSNSQSNPATLASSNSVVGLYSSSTDPVHVPSPDSRSSAGVVGVRRQPTENTAKHSSAPNSSISNSVVGRDNSSESFRPFTGISKADQFSQNTHTESVVPSMSTSRLPSNNNNQYNSRPHQVVGHQKALQPNKEWKPKSSQKSSVVNPGVIGTPTKSAAPPAENSKDLESEAAKLQDKISRVNIHENQNVIIAQHIRVPETDRPRLTFGSFGEEFDSSRNFASRGAADESVGESVASLSVSAPESSTDDASGCKQADLLDEHLRNSGSDSASEHHLVDKKDSSSPQSMENYADIGLVRDSSPSYAPSVSQQQHDPPELPTFSAYDPQTGYEMPYFRSTKDESVVRGQGLPSPQEALSSHTANAIPASTIAMVQQQQQQQQQQVPQMYPQVHVSHYANLMPYRQFLSPVYVPPMMPGYSSNPAYPHPSNGNSYLLMHGGGSHMPNGLKFGIQQFKPVPAGSPTGFGNFPSPSGYAAINAPGVVGGATGLEDSSRMKYKDGNLYVPNPQAETSEIWIQNPRDIPAMQSAQYYNMPGQTPHAAYMPSHTGHASFNPAVAQSSHMQYQGLYHPQQPAAMANPHHLGPAMGGNVGVGVAPAAPGAQVGAYQQPQLGHLNWTTNF